MPFLTRRSLWTNILCSASLQEVVGSAHNLSAIAAALGHILVSSVESSACSVQRAASAPKNCFARSPEIVKQLQLQHDHI